MKMFQQNQSSQMAQDEAQNLANASELIKGFPN